MHARNQGEALSSVFCTRLVRRLAHFTHTNGEPTCSHICFCLVRTCACVATVPLRLWKPPRCAQYVALLQARCVCVCVCVRVSVCVCVCVCFCLFFCLGCLAVIDFRVCCVCVTSLAPINIFSQPRIASPAFNK